MITVEVIWALTIIGCFLIAGGTILAGMFLYQSHLERLENLKTESRSLPRWPR